MARQREWVAGGLVALVAAALLWWSPWADREQAAEQADEAGESDVLAARRAARRSGQVDVSPATLAGRVVDADTGDGIPGALVSLRTRRLGTGGRGAPGESPAPITAVTGEGGRFSAADLPPGLYSVAATADGYRPALVENVSLGGGEVEDGVVVTLRAGGQRLSGRVTDIGGGAVAGALVQATRTDDATITTLFRAPYTASTDGDGGYVLPLERGSYRVRVFHPDYVAADEGVRIDASDRTLDFVLTPGAAIEGRVVRRADDSPVAGATVAHARLGQTGGFTVSGISEHPPAITDAEGRFRMSGLEGGAITLRAWGPGYASAEPTLVELGIAETATDVVVYVDEAFTISGFVVDADDRERAVAGALVGAFNMSPGALYAATDPSAEDGYFEIHGVRPGLYTVGLMAEGRVPKVFGAQVTVKDADVDDVLLEVDAGATLRGRVEPAAVADITLGVDSDQIGLGNIVQVMGAALVHGKSDADGRFAVTGVGAGHYTLSARAEDGREGTLELDVAGEDLDDLVVRLEERATVSGVVIDEGGAPVEGVQIHLDEIGGRRQGGFAFRMGNGAGASAITGPDGRFEARGVDDGRYDLSVKEDWATTLRWADEEGDAATEPIELTVADARDVTGLRLVVESQTGVITGLVRGADGAPLADAWVTARSLPEGVLDREDADADEDEDENADEGDRRRRRRWGPSEQPVLTGADGRFRIEGLREGRYDLEAEASRGGARGRAEDVGTGSSVTIRVEGLGSLAGTVTRGGAPITDYVVQVSGPTRRRVTVANPSGTYELPRLEPGDYRISITSDDGRADAEATVESGRGTTRDLTLASYGSVSGRLVDAKSGEPLAGFPVFARIGDDDAAVGRAFFEAVQGSGPRTDDDGRFRVPRLGAGSGELWILDDEQAGFSMIATESFTLASGQDLDLGTIRGTVTPRVPDEERGELGLEAGTATWSRRPGGADGDEPPAGLDAEAEHLWVSSVAEGGPAMAAGVEVGDRIVSINGVDVAAVGPAMGQRLLSPVSIRAGATVTLGLVRDGSPTTASLTAAPAAKE